MKVSAQRVICPYCKSSGSKSVVLGTSGLINYNGNTTQVTCGRCKKEFLCIVDVSIKFKTQKLD